MSENCITKVSYLKESLNEMLQETIEIYEQMIELLEGALLDSEDSVRIQGVVFMLVYAIVTWGKGIFRIQERWAIFRKEMSHVMASALWGERSYDLSWYQANARQ